VTIYKSAGGGTFTAVPQKRGRIEGNPPDGITLMPYADTWYTLGLTGVAQVAGTTQTATCIMDVDGSACDVQVVLTLSGANTSAPLPGVSDLSGLLPGESAGAIGVADNLRSSPARLLAGVLYRSQTSPVSYRLSLFSDLRFQPQQRLRIEVRRSRIRSDIPLNFETVTLTEPIAVPQGPFAVSQFRYDLDLPDTAFGGLTADQSYSLSLRVINQDSMPLTEQQLLRFKLK
jgi:hypothetical protein